MDKRYGKKLIAEDMIGKTNGVLTVLSVDE